MNQHERLIIMSSSILLFLCFKSIVIERGVLDIVSSRETVPFIVFLPSSCGNFLTKVQPKNYSESSMI